MILIATLLHPNSFNLMVNCGVVFSAHFAAPSIYVQINHLLCTHYSQSGRFNSGRNWVCHGNAFIPDAIQIRGDSSGSASVEIID